MHISSIIVEVLLHLRVYPIRSARSAGTSLKVYRAQEVKVLKDIKSRPVSIYLPMEVVKVRGDHTNCLLGILNDVDQFL